jgi:hypothetical protein
LRDSLSSVLQGLNQSSINLEEAQKAGKFKEWLFRDLEFDIFVTEKIANVQFNGD